MKRKLVQLTTVALAMGAALGAYGKSFSLDLRRPSRDGARMKLMSAAPAQGEGTLRSFDLDAGVADVGAVAVGDVLTFVLFDDVTLTLTLKERLPAPLGGDVFLAEAAGCEGVKTAVVLRTDDGLTIDVQDIRSKKYYKVLSAPDGVKVQEVAAKGSACRCGARTPAVTPKMRSAKKALANVSAAPAGNMRLQALGEEAEGPFVDILVAFDGNAGSWAKNNGGGLTNFAQTAVQKMNLALANTGLDASFRFRLVGVMGLTASSADLDYVLDAASEGWSGWRAIRENRDKVGADIVTVLVDTGSQYGTTGLGFSLYDDDFDSFSEFAYNVCAIRAVAQSHTMTHEVGHNMGCGHSDVQAVQPGPLLYDYSAGYYFAAGGEGFHTIMAYDGEGPRGDEIEVPYFSSPNHKYRGVTVGNNKHDNTRTLANTFAAVGKWRAAAGEDLDDGRMDLPLEWETSRSAAWARARAEGKNVFLISGRDTCGNTMATRNYSCEVPDVKRHLLRDYVCWYNVIDTQYTESQKYFSGYDVGGTLPFIAIIDAAKDVTLVAEGGYHEAMDLIMMLGRVAKEVAITPDGGRSTDPIQVTLTAKSGGVIYYTLDGTMPDETSLRYEGPITLDVSATICAREFAGGEFGLPARADFVRELAEKHGGYEWTVNVVEGGCVVKSVTPAPAGTVVLPSCVMGFDVVGFDETVFQDNLNITSLVVPASVRHFDGWSFHGSRNLTAIHVDAANENMLSEGGIVYDKKRTTLMCCPPGVAYLEIPDDVLAIGDDACVGLWNVKEVYIPANVIGIGFEAFAGCNMLSTVVIAESVTEIDYDAFSYCPKLTNAWLPRRLEYSYMEYDSFYKRTGSVSLHYYEGGMETFMVHFDPCDIALEAVSRKIPALQGTALTTVGPLPGPARLNYKFVGWFTAPDGGTKITATTKVTDDVVYYAHWEYDGSAPVNVVVAEGCEAMGKVTGGNATFKAGAKVSVKASPNSGYVFVGWYDDGGTNISQAASFTYVATGEETTLTARFMSAEDDGASIKFAVNGMSSASAETPISTNVMCGVTLKWPLTARAESGAKLKVAGLPAGLKFTDKDILKKGSKTEVEIPANTIYGVPTAASKVGRDGGVAPYPVKITVTTGGKSSATYLLNLTVDPLPAWAIGSFEGFVRQAASDAGVASMSVTAAGKISGKVAWRGTNWTFKADAYGIESVTVGATNLVVSATATAGKATLDLALDLADFPLDYLPGSATARAEGLFGTTALQFNRLPWTDKNDAGAKAHLAPYVGAYSCKVAYGGQEGVAAFTVDEKGVTKGSIVLPDGTKTRKVSFAGNVIPNDGSLYVAIAAPPDAKKGYPPVFAYRQITASSGPDSDKTAFRDPGVLVAVQARNKDSGASGTVTMNPKYGQAAAGKVVTLTAKAAAGSVFSCWVVAGSDTRGLDLTSPTIKLKANGTNDIHVTAQFVTRGEDQAEISLIVDKSSLYGEVNDPGKTNVAKRVCCGVFVDWAVRASAYSQATIKAEKLPNGLKLVQDRGTKAYSIAGVPTKEGTFLAKFTVTTAGKSKETVLLPITVKAMPEGSVGSYSGLIGEFEDEADDSTWRASGMVTLSVAANGKLSAKATLPSGAISFAANGWDSESNGFYRVEMSTKAGDRLFLKLDSNRDWRGARIEMPDSVLETAKGAAYRVVAWRNEHGKTGNIVASKTASDFIARIVALKKLCFRVTGDAEAGYACTEVPATDKTANLTLTFDAKGNVKYSGKIGGKSISGTAVLNIDGADHFTIGDLVVPLGKTEALYFALGFDRDGNGDPEPNLDIFRVTERK